MKSAMMMAFSLKILKKGAVQSRVLGENMVRYYRTDDKVFD